jgi:glycosyltransferase involved in cell wall biosynthesis
LARMRVLFALPGLHRYDRGAEIALISVAKELANRGNSITVIGSGSDRASCPYRFLRANSIRRECFERFPMFPPFRSEYAFEEFTFVPGLLWKYRPSEYDATVTCSYPFTNWILRRPRIQGPRPPHIFVTQNGDWPAYAQNSEYRFFGCEGLVCTNPDFYERNKDRWNCRLIPNGIDNERFAPSKILENFAFPPEKLIVLMVSALIPTKRVSIGIESVSKIPNAFLVVAGDGPLRDEIDAEAAKLLPGRFKRLSVEPAKMPALYQSADVFLHLSREESFGNVFLEAMASGLPVVAHDSPRLRWILGDEELLTDTDDQDLIVEAILAASHENHSRAKERAKRAETFSWSKISSAYQEFLTEITALARS